MARGLGGDDVYAQAVLEYLLDPGGHQCHKPHATAQVPNYLPLPKCKKN